MSADAGQHASDLAARQVEQIVSAAQDAAEEIRDEARIESRDMATTAQRECDEALQRARRAAEDELSHARKQAILLGQDARRDAEALVDDAQQEAAQLREKARRAVDGRVAAAERAAAEVLEEARALSAGLRQLGKALEDHADRILRDVTAAHKRMQSDLRLGPVASDGASPAPEAPAEDEAAGTPKRRNPFEEIELPSWVGRER